MWTGWVFRMLFSFLVLPVSTFLALQRPLAAQPALGGSRLGRCPPAKVLILCGMLRIARNHAPICYIDIQIYMHPVLLGLDPLAVFESTNMPGRASPHRSKQTKTTYKLERDPNSSCRWLKCKYLVSKLEPLKVAIYRPKLIKHYSFASVSWVLLHRGRA